MYWRLYCVASPLYNREGTTTGQALAQGRPEVTWRFRLHVHTIAPSPFCIEGKPPRVKERTLRAPGVLLLKQRIAIDRMAYPCEVHSYLMSASRDGPNGKEREMLILPTPSRMSWPTGMFSCE